MLKAILLLMSSNGIAQVPDSLFVHLYTDSLKCSTHNYINIDGRLPNGQYQPLDTLTIQFATSYGHFEGNNLVLPAVCSVPAVTITVWLKRNPAIQRRLLLPIKQTPDPPLPVE